jgi:hypothetical protein
LVTVMARYQMYTDATVSPAEGEQYASVIIVDTHELEVVARYHADTATGTKRERAELFAAQLNEPKPYDVCAGCGRSRELHVPCGIDTCGGCIAGSGCFGFESEVSA